MDRAGAFETPSTAHTWWPATAQQAAEAAARRQAEGAWLAAAQARSQAQHEADLATEAASTAAAVRPPGCRWWRTCVNAKGSALGGLWLWCCTPWTIWRRPVQIVQNLLPRPCGLRWRLAQDAARALAAACASVTAKVDALQQEPAAAADAGQVDQPAQVRVPAGQAQAAVAQIIFLWARLSLQSADAGSASPPWAHLATPVLH